jgi:chaperonin GroES
MNINSVKPILDMVFIEPLKSEEKTKGGILIPDTVKEKPQQGKVIAVGKGKKDEPMIIKSGDIVLYGKYSGTEIQINGIDYLFMKESDIYATI